MIRQTVFALFKMSRPAHLLLLTGVYIFGSIITLAMGFPINAAAFAIGLLVFVPTCASVHYANEYADFETDALTERTPYSGGSGALYSSGLPRRLALLAAWVSLILASVLAILSWSIGLLTPLALLILALGAFCGWMYSLPPLALAWHGWGEVTNAWLGGMLVPVYAYSVQTGTVSHKIALASLPLCMLVFNNLLATQWPDRQADAAVGKHTLVTRWPSRQLRWTYFTAAAIAYLSLLLYRESIFPRPVVWSSFLVLPVALWGGLEVTHKHSPFSSVAAMVLLLIVQSAAWWVTLLH